MWASLEGTHWTRAATIASAFVALEEFDMARADAALETMDASAVDYSDRPLIEYLRAQCALLRDDAFAGLARLDAFVARAGDTQTGNLHRSLLASIRSDLLLALQQPQEAGATLKAFTGPREGTVAATARWLLFSGQTVQAVTLVEKWIWRKSIEPRRRAELLLVRALAAERLDDRKAATDAWARAFALHEQSGVGLPFAVVGDETARRLSAGCGLEIPTALAFPSVYPVMDASMPKLSPREMLVLQRLAKTASMEAIASSLVVSPNTVKTQVRSVYRKLGARSRHEALIAAARWGMLRLRVDGEDITLWA
jgi:LuxR family maltose regulon positive regulatory protein